MKTAKLALVALAAFLLALPPTAAWASQTRPQRLTEQEMKGLLERIDKQAERLRGSIDEALDESTADGTRLEDQMNNFFKNFAEATDRLKGRFDDDQSAAGTVQDVLNRAVEIERFMATHRLTGRAQDDWMALRSSLDELAAAYNVTWSWAGVSDVAHRASDKEVRNILDRVEKDADRFRSSLDSSLDRSRFDGSKAEDNINEFMKHFEEATDRLEDRFGKNQSAAADVEDVLRRAESIDSFVIRNQRSLSPRVMEDWMTLRRDLDDLARAYNVGWTWRVYTVVAVPDR